MSQELNFILKKLAAELKTDELSIPSLPELVNQLSRQIGNPNLSVKELANIICSDTGITSRIIRTAQTLRYSNPGTTVTSIPNAISRIGITSSINLALALALEQNFNFKIPLIKKLCRQIVQQNNEIALASLGVCTAKYMHIPPLTFDYVVLASSLLNIGYLPFLFELESFCSNRANRTVLTLTEQQIREKCEGIQYPLAVAILRHWKFDESFECAIKLEEDRTYEFYVNSLTYGKMYLDYQKSQGKTIYPPESLTEVIAHKFTQEELEPIQNWLNDNGLIY